MGVAATFNHAVHDGIALQEPGLNKELLYGSLQWGRFLKEDSSATNKDCALEFSQLIPFITFNNEFYFGANILKGF